MTTIVLSPEHGYNLASMVLTSVAVFGIGMVVGAQRPKLGVELPNMYADEARAKSDKNAHRFNCYQRGHQNLLETVPFQFVFQLIGGIKYPLVCAGLGLAYCVGAIQFFRGYSSGDPKSRYNNVAGLLRLSFVGSLGVAGYVLFQIITAGKL